MQTKTIPTGETPELVLELRRNLKLAGVEGVTEIVINTSDEARLEVEQHAGKVIVRCDKDVEVTAPVNAVIRIPRVRGNAQLTKLHGDVDIDRIHGSLRLDDLKTTHINQVDGNLDAFNLGDAFSCGGVGGNAVIRGADCPIALSTGGNLDLENVPGKVSGSAGGNARLVLSAAQSDDDAINVHLNAGGQAWLDISAGDVDRVHVTAGGNIDCRVSEDTGATVNIASGRGIQTLKLGDGSGSISLTCGGNAHLSGAGQPSHVHSWSDGDSERASKATKTIRLGEKRVVRFEVGISLRIEGYDGDEVLIERGGMNLQDLQDIDGEIHVQAGMDCRARVPNNTVIHAEVGVDAQVHDFEGELNLEAGASARVKNFVGVAHIEAGAEAKVEFVPTGDSHIEAGADARCWIPSDANVTVNLEDMRGERTQVFGDGAIKVDVNAGMSAKVFDTGSDEDEGINFKFDHDRGFVASVAPEIEKQILEFTAEMTTAATRLSEGVSTIPMPDWLKGEVGDMHRRVEEATRRAQERIARRIESATRRAERKAQKAGKRGVQVRGDFDIDLPFFKRKIEFNTEFPRPPEPPRPPESPASPMPPTPPSPFAANSKPDSEPVSNQERMTILRMLEQKKITAEQAAQLLAAMGE